MLRGVRTPDIVRVKRKAHHAPVLHAFSIERVELVFDHLQEVICLTVPCQHARIVCLAGIRNVDKLLAAPHIDRPGLIIDDPRRVIETAGFGHQIICPDGVAGAAAEPSFQTFAGHLL